MFYKTYGRTCGWQEVEWQQTTGEVLLMSGVREADPTHQSSISFVSRPVLDTAEFWGHVSVHTEAVAAAKAAAAAAAKAAICSQCNYFFRTGTLSKECVLHLCRHPDHLQVISEYDRVKGTQYCHDVVMTVPRILVCLP
jgi:hypothetical protein